MSQQFFRDRGAECTRIGHRSSQSRGKLLLAVATENDGFQRHRIGGEAHGDSDRRMTPGAERGQDLSLGYLSHDAENVTLYLEQSFSFHVATPEAAVPLAEAT